MAEHTARHHAILIGINTPDSEDGKGLRGCVPDVEEITKQLERSSIEGLSIYTFTASPQLNSSQPTEPKERWPTYDNIRSRLCRVIQEARRGDYVYIHFSGHSTVVHPTQPHSNWDTGDLALVVLDGLDACEERYFHGTELAEHLRDMVDKGVGVTIVLDCCYSGSTLRNDEVVRYVPYRPEIDMKYPPRAKAAQHTVHSDYSTLRGERRPSLIPNWLANPEGYAILTSGDATEKAYDIRFDKSKDGLRHGTLTFFLLVAFDELDGVGGSMHQLHQHISAKIVDHRRYHGTKTQNPVLFGNKKQLFFGLPRLGCSGDIPITKTMDGGASKLWLHAGAAQGISEGDQFVLRPLAPPANDTQITAEAINIRGITTDLRITGENTNTNAIETGWLATAITRLSLRRFPVRLSVSQAYQAEWQKELRQHLSLAEHDEDDIDSASGWSFMIVRINDMEYEIRDDGNQAITRISAVGSPERVRQQVLSQMRHLASFRLVRDLTNRAMDAKTLQFKTSFSAVLENKEGRRLDPGCTRTGDLHQVCPHPECRLTLAPADVATLIVENKVGRDGPLLFLYVYALGSGWQVEEITTSSRKVIPPAGSSNGYEAKGVFRGRMRFRLEEGERTCEDVLKVFLTRQPTSFTILELPRLGESANGAEENMSGNRGNPLCESEDWAALTFRIHIASKGVE